MTAAKAKARPVDREIRRLAADALEVAAAAPVRKNRYSATAQIPWTLIERIREDLEAAGVDWRQFKRDAEARRENPNRNSKGSRND